jgi:hypothetical protein
MDDAILDHDEINFSRGFYAAIGYGRSFESSFNKAKATVRLEATTAIMPRLLARQLNA